MSEQRILCLVGGGCHDFDEAEEHFGQEFRAFGLSTSFTRDHTTLGRVSHADADLVFIYTCFGEELEETQAANLLRFVETGGGLFAMHGATASFTNSATYLALVGARFRDHPPRHNFLVEPLDRPHPVIEGVEAFTVNDELYLEEYAPDIQVHMVTSYFGRAHPLLWTRNPGAGRVCYLALGHDLDVWQQPPVRQLVCNALAWVGNRQ